MARIGEPWKGRSTTTMFYKDTVKGKVTGECTNKQDNTRQQIIKCKVYKQRTIKIKTIACNYTR
jgi:hypothetical protein